MNIRTILQRILHRGKSPEQATMDYCYAHGFSSGKNFHFYSGYPIDANWPWLISVGDNVTLSSGVRLLAHDASTVKTGAHTKIGIVQICSFEDYQNKHLENLKTHTYFSNHPWYDWPNASTEEREKMRRELEDSFGYV